MIICTKINCVVIRLCCLHIIIYKLLSLQQKNTRKMTAETIQLIQTGINILCASGVISTLLYYNSRKRKEAAIASQEENKTISSYADEWKALYERSNDSVVNLNSKVDELYEEINQYRITIRNLRDEKNDLKLALHEAQWNRCIKDGCQLRTPPRKRESLESLVEKEEDAIYRDRED